MKDNKGFATSFILFALLSLFLILMSVLLFTMSNSSILNNSLKNKIISEVDYSNKTMLIDGKRLNVRMKQLAGNNNATYETEDNNIKEIAFSSTIDDKYKLHSNRVTIDSSDVLVYMWYENNIIYLYTESKNIYLNTDSSYLFYNLKSLENVNVFDKLDSSLVTNMEYMFSKDSSLVELSLSNLDTIKVTNMDNMFSDCNNLERIYVSGKFSTSNVTTSENMFYNDVKLKGENNTEYSSKHIDKEYARVDETNSKGYFSFYTKTVSFNAKDKQETYKIVKSGTYILEVWGASGADATETYIGGYGGYSKGEIYLEKGTTLYINVGTEGKKFTYSPGTTLYADGGYNGGGTGGVSSSGSDWTQRNLFAGGGATHIATESGELKDLKSKKDKILIVAGGGGSGSAQTNGYYYSYTIGGSGGGFKGGNLVLSSRSFTCGLEGSTTFESTGGTQESCGYFKSCSTVYDSKYDCDFGQASQVKSSLTTDFASWGGGGGLYGGLFGAGGSGYLSTSLNNKVMFCYNCEEDSHEATKTISTTGESLERNTTNCQSGYSDNLISKCAKKGDGGVKIEYKGSN